MIFPLKHALETYSEVIPLWSREEENYVGLQKHTSELVVLNLWISQCHRGHPKRVPQSPQHISRIVKDKHQETLNFNEHTKEEITHENILLTHVQYTAVTMVSGIILD